LSEETLKEEAEKTRHVRVSPWGSGKGEKTSRGIGSRDEKRKSGKRLAE